MSRSISSPKHLVRSSPHPKIQCWHFISDYIVFSVFSSVRFSTLDGNTGNCNYRCELLILFGHNSRPAQITCDRAKSAHKYGWKKIIWKRDSQPSVICEKSEILKKKKIHSHTHTHSEVLLLDKWALCACNKMKSELIEFIALWHEIHCTYIQRRHDSF